VTRKISGIPVISILGLLTLISGVAVEYALLLPAITNFGYIVATGILPTFLIGAILYAIIWTVRRRQGINLEFVGKLIPPE
jgi:hypothetical protein